MPSVLRELSVLTTVIVDNTISGSIYEYARGAGLFSAGVTGSATGFVDTINVGPMTAAESFAIPIATRYPIIPDEMYFTAQLNGGERIVFRAQNTSGGTLIHRTLAQFSFQG